MNFNLEIWKSKGGRKGVVFSFSGSNFDYGQISALARAPAPFRKRFQLLLGK